MAIPIPSPLIEFILLGPQDDRRQLQDSPILGDVWVEFGKSPSRALDLLIAPYRGAHAGKVAAEIHRRLSGEPQVGVQLLSLDSSARLPATDWDKVVFSAVDEGIHVQVFNDQGRVTDSYEPKKDDVLRGKLEGLWPPHHLSNAEKLEVLKLVEPGVFEKVAGQDAQAIAHLQGLVAARLRFDQVLRVVVPMTKWWIDKWGKPDETAPKRGRRRKEGGVAPAAPAVRHRLQEYEASDAEKVLEKLLSTAKEWLMKTSEKRPQDLSPLDRFVALTGLILWAADHHRPGPLTAAESAEDQIQYILKEAKAKELSERFVEIVGAMLGASKSKERPYEEEPSVYQLSLNRVAMPALTKSIPAVKADAAKTLFKVDCSQIVWAVIDAGIDATHPAFRLPPYPQPPNGRLKSRVKRAFDFKNFRRIVSLGNATEAVRQRNIRDLLDSDNRLLDPPTKEKAHECLKKLAEDAEGGPIHWEMVRQFVEIDPGAPPPSKHGTHVAGILGASKDAAQQLAGGRASDDFADGMCPDIRLFDFRVLGADVRDTEFAIIAALQFLRYLNAQDNFLTIHGANLSLSIPHDVRNYACGRTPICEECERLVESGVVVVAAAGNHGYQNFQTRDGSYEGYAAFSITDPGNAHGVITVGSTHRFWPHTYGVSFFSSRGPTGDGRLKPDLVAPGERIHATIPGGKENLGGDWGDDDGTSMAAPHVSGAAAMLMGRYSELVGQPRRLKRILCESATDLGRERSFQGHGMLDVLRAFQSI